MANRVTAAITRTRERLATLSPEQRAKLDKNLDLTFHEHFEYQQQQAQAHAAGKITTEEAQIVYQSLGEIGSQKNGGWASGTDLAHKIVVTQMIGELLGVGRQRARSGLLKTAGRHRKRGFSLTRHSPRARYRNR